MNRQHLNRLRSRALFTFVGGVLVINPLFAQDAAKDEKKEGATQLEEVVVTGMRNALEESMSVRRDSAGVVDAITSEDIGKFPDTNLAESLQRITGISIERRDGEGAQVTARGFGPQFNLVTLNGRQIPGADAFGAPGQVPIGGVDGGTRAFNFAQLASEAITGLEVYKTGQAHVPSGGIGATINIVTARPLDRQGLVASTGVKSVYDDSAPFDNKITPEASGIFSYSNDDRTWGVGLSGSFQKRRGGSIQATENNWNIQRWTGTEPALRPGAVVTNAPQIGQLYGMPNDIRYAFADFDRERVNAQGVLQFAPTDSLTLTLDYTYGDNEITEDRGEQTQWLQRANSFTALEFDTGQAVATPVYLRDVVGLKDFGYEQQRNMQKYRLDSLGFNAEWSVSDSLSFEFDGHRSKSRSMPNDPFTGGGATYFSFAGTNNCQAGGPYCNGNWAQEFRFNNGLPIAARTWYPTIGDALAGRNGVVNPDFPPEQLGSQVLRVNAQRQETEVTGGRIDGEWRFDQGRFQFGVDSQKTEMNRRQNTERYAALGDWGVANAGREPGMVALLRPFSITGLFTDFGTSGIPSGAWRGNASDLARWAAGQYNASPTVNPQLAADNLIEESVDAVYVQLEYEAELAGLSTDTRIGLRYERTDLTSTSAVAIPSAIEWQANNDFRIVRSDEIQPFSEESDYSHLLPNIDFSIDFTSDIKGRASYSKTIARAPFGNLYAGPGPNQPTGSILINPSTRATGNAQNPGLNPLESDNLDVAVEWYFAPSSYVQVTYWNKNVENFIGNSVVRESLYDLRDPTSGPDAQAALAFLLSDACRRQVTTAGNDVQAACSANDTALFTALALLRNSSTGGLGAYNGSAAQVLDMEFRFDIYGEADDPLYLFDVNRPVNQRTAKLSGWEIGGQYFFGDSGFGVYANYTVVNGDVGIDNAGDPGVDQFALLGLSDTANAMLMYEKNDWSVRLAWNWRDEYLLLANQGGSRNPFYVEAYDQWDLSASYRFSDRFTVGLEVINLTGEDIRWHGRSDKQFIRLVDQSPRYMLGLRYEF
jgi:TonB-dependent receptor